MLPEEFPYEPSYRGRLKTEAQLRNRVFDCLGWPSLDGLAGGLCGERRRLFGKWIDSFACRFGRLLDDDELGESRQDEHALFLEFIVSNLGQRIENFDHILTCPALAHVFEDGCDQCALCELLDCLRGGFCFWFCQSRFSLASE